MFKSIKSNKSSSFHVFNADRNIGMIKMNIIEKIIWILLNLINNNLPPKSFKYRENYPNLSLKNFAKIIHDKEWNIISNNSTPSRILCDLFWIKQMWNDIKSEIGPINIFDTGCGDGNYGLKINAYASGINSYTGIDTVEYRNWLNLKNQAFIKLIKFSSNNFMKKIPDNINFFMTQSAIEHFDYDMEYFKVIKRYIEKNNSNVIQIHLFPAPPSLWLYLHHGVRQYNMRSIQKIVKLFNNDKTYAVTFPLGGKESFLYHLKNITIPEYFLKSKNNLRKSKPEKYFLGAKQSIIKDINKNSWNYASFCALVIHSNYKNKIF